MAITRYFVFVFVLALALICGAFTWLFGPWWEIPLLVLVPLVLLGIYDMLQRSHAVLRNYPLTGHIRFLLESVRTEIRQYFIENETDELPFSLRQRSLVYRRAKAVDDSEPFGSVLDFESPGYSWIAHSIRPAKVEDSDFRLTIGGPDCRQPYRASILNISGTSFGSMSANAIMAFNRGAKLGNFAHNTGEGSISAHHRLYGGDLIWQIATGYFGCRDDEGRFDPERFRKRAADPQVRMIELKLSQGAKPGHGGILPKAKITAEIAETRDIPMGRDCISPRAHSTFSTPLELMAFIARLRELADGKPIGLKLALGYRHEFMALAKAMLESGVTPDFIVVDGGEGGTGAAPMEMTNHVGMPLADGLHFVHNVLVGVGLRQHIRLGGSGKIVSAYDLARVLALGADYAMAARAFMFAVGCIQSRTCHTNNCPTGVATQDKGRQRALDVIGKSERVHNFHRRTLYALGELLGAVGLTSPSEIAPHHFQTRAPEGDAVTGAFRAPGLVEGALLGNDVIAFYRDDWRRAQAHSFAPMELERA
ncbi:MAG TPA: FMN-binding glutamate synthase family protein [Novosphingobium sp.]